MARAFTLGNPKSYEPALAKGEVEKAPGGVVFTSQDRAQAVLDHFGGHLPPRWFGGRMIPGRVYALDLPGPVCEVTERRDYGLALRVPAPCRRLDPRDGD